MDTTLSLTMLSEARPVAHQAGLATLAGDCILGATVSSDGTLVACWSIDHHVAVWALKSGELLFNSGRLGRGANQRIEDVRFDAQAKHLCIIHGQDTEGRLTVWNIRDQLLLWDSMEDRDFVQPKLGDEFQAAFTTDSKRLAIVSGEDVWVLDVVTGKVVIHLEAPGRITRMDWTYDECLRAVWDRWDVDVLFKPGDDGLLTYPGNNVSGWRQGKRGWDQIEGVDPATVGGTDGIHPTQRSGQWAIRTLSAMSGMSSTVLLHNKDRLVLGAFLAPANVTYLGLTPDADFVLVGTASGDFAILKREDKGSPNVI
jgi:hypothetical protein